MKNKLTLLNFERPEDLLAGIDLLQHHHVMIRELYAAKPIPGMETKLNLNRSQFGEAIFRFGCLGGMGITSLVDYFLRPQENWKTALLTTGVLLMTVFLAGCLFPVKATRFFTLKPGDRRYLAVVDTQRIPVNESIARLFQYTGAVELSPAIKNIVIS